MARLGNPDWKSSSPYEIDSTLNEDDLSPLDNDYIPEEYQSDSD